MALPRVPSLNSLRGLRKSSAADLLDSTVRREVLDGHALHGGALPLGFGRRWNERERALGENQRRGKTVGRLWRVRGARRRSGGL